MTPLTSICDKKWRHCVSDKEGSSLPVETYDKKVITSWEYKTRNLIMIPNPELILIKFYTLILYNNQYPTLLFPFT